MLKLDGRVFSIHNLETRRAGRVFRLSSDRDAIDAHKASGAYLATSLDIPKGFAAYLAFGELAVEIRNSLPHRAVIGLTDDYRYLKDGDIVRITAGTNRIRVLYRRSSPHNSFLVTERCDNYCLMCSQPPKLHDDSWIIDEILEAIPLIDPETAALGFTGGEPTLIGERLIEVLLSCKKHLPRTAVHVLSNGRRFSDASFSRRWASVGHHDLMVGIPLYADVSTIHDYVVQADGAFDETVRGILNLKRFNSKVELRVVLHKQTYRTLPRLAEFIARNLLFVDQVALMGLEITGFTRANLDTLWIDPLNYQAELREAVDILAESGIHVRIYNHPLCVLDHALWPFAIKSISDWKNEYIEECTGCSVKSECGGFFASAKYRRSEHIKAVT